MSTDAAGETTEGPGRDGEVVSTHAYLDRFSIIGHCLIADGWADPQDIAVWYDGEPLTISTTSVERIDLVGVFGPASQKWGFALCAAIQTADIDHRKFRLQLNDGFIVDDPASGFSRAYDRKFEAMAQRFRDEVAEKSGRLLEIGSRARSGNVYRNWFPNDIDYVGMDVMDGPNVDVVGDAHHLSRHVDGLFDFVFSMAVFEHILMPWKVALEMNKVMQVGAVGLIISHAAWPLHEEPWDFFRFSKDSWSGLFNEHTGFEVVDAQYQHQASIIPHYAHNEHFRAMTWGPTYLLSGCLVRKTHQSKVAWEAEAAGLYDLGYSHA